MTIDTNKLYKSYPEEAKTMLAALRKLILETGEEYELGPVEESLKWGELSFATRNGSTVRIDWKPRSGDQCFVFFHCQTRLVETFKEIYGDLFHYEGKRAIVFNLSDKLPEGELKHCLSLALQYHKVKHLPLLGA